MAFNLANMFRPTQQVALPQGGQQGYQQPQGGQPQGQPPQGQQGRQQGPNNGPGSSMNNNNPGADPNNPGTGPQNQGAQQGSPLDSFSKLWETDPKAQKPVDPWADPLIPTDPTKIAEVAGNYNFLEGLPQDLMQKVMAGNDPQSLVQLINTVAQRSLALSTQISSATANKAGVGVRDRFSGTLESKFREFQLNNAPPPKNPALAHPAAKPMVDMIRKQIAGQNPQMRPDEVNAMAEEYFTNWSAQFNAGNLENGVAPGTAKPKEEDWSSFLGS